MENTLQLPAKRLREILAFTIKNDKKGVKDLLAKNGFDASNLNTDDLHIAFLKAIKDSPVFRNQVADKLAESVKKIKTRSKSGITAMSLNFVNQPQLQFVNQPQLGFVTEPQLDLGFDTTAALSDYTAPSLIVTPAAPAPTPTPASSGGFWDSLSSLANKDNLNKLFNTGLDTLSTSLKNSSNSSSEQNALELERLRLQQIQAQNALADKQGMPTWAVVSIVVVALGLVGTGIYFAVKKKGKV